MVGEKRNLLQELQDFYEDYCISIREEADALRCQSMPGLTEELFSLFEKTGNRLIYEEVYFLRRKMLAIFGLKAILDREKEDIEKLEEVLLAVCGEECWALPAHVKRDADKNWRSFVDLFAAETAQTLAEMISVLDDVLSGEVKARVREEVLRRVLTPFSESVPPYGHWEYGTTNWCAVCGGSVGSAAIYLWRDEPERLQGLLERIYNSLKNYYLKGFTEDGTCVEGLGYFTYGMTYYTGFAEQLSAFTEGRMDLLHFDKLQKIAEFQAKCYFKSGTTVSFSDGFTRDTFRVGLSCYLALQYPGAELPAMSRAEKLRDEHCFRWMGLYRNLIWTRQYIEHLEKLQNEMLSGGRDAAESGESRGGRTAAGKEQENDRKGCQITLPDAQWTICQSAGEEGMAAKGGHNGEPHNHNDVGSFYYLSGEDILLADLGCGEYTKDYFAEGRYKYLCCRSLGHNVPLIDGKEQLPGEEYRCRSFETDGNGRTVLEFAKAYGNPGLLSLVRTLSWNGGNGSLAVEDAFEFTGDLQTITENLVTQQKPEIQGNTIRLQGEKRGCLITIEGPEAEVSSRKEQFSNHDGILEDVWLLQWEVPLSRKEGRAIVRFCVETVQDEREIPAYPA